MPWTNRSLDPNDAVLQVNLEPAEEGLPDLVDFPGAAVDRRVVVQ